MSHKIVAHTKITERDYLLRALGSLGWTYNEAITGNINLGNGSVYLSQRQDNSWQIEGDPYYDKGELSKYYGRTNELITDLQTNYNTIMAKDKLENMGFYLQQEESNREEIVLTFDNGY